MESPVVVLIVALAFLSSASAARAAAPAWKLLAVTGPSNLPPKQSEMQRLTVEAEGGAYRLFQAGIAASEGEVTPAYVEVELSLTTGSRVATIITSSGNATVQSGDRVSDPNLNAEPKPTTVLSCSADCKTPGSTITLNSGSPPTFDRTVNWIIYTRQFKVIKGDFTVGEEVTGSSQQGEPIEYFPGGTVVTGVGPEEIELSSPPFGQGDNIYREKGTPIELFTSRTTQSIPVGSSAAEVQSALSTLVGDGTVSVTGGPGGTSPKPYFIDYSGAEGRGRLSNRDVAQLNVVKAELLGETANANVFTTVPGGPGTGEIVVDPTNIGSAPSQGPPTITIGPLPPSIRATGAAESAEEHGGWDCSEEAESRAFVCTFESSVPALSPLQPVRLPVEVESEAIGSSLLPVRISGGGADPEVFQLPVVISATPAPFATRAFWAGAFDAEGRVETQAGAHPESAQTFFLLNTVRSGGGLIVPAGVLKNIAVDLPPGLTGNLLSTPRCPQDQPAAGITQEFPVCNSAMVVGKFGIIAGRLTFGANGIPSRIFNDVPAYGSAAEFTTQIAAPNQSLFGSVRSSEDFGVRISAPNVANLEKLFGSYAALEGRPGAANGKAFLTNPTDCAGEAQQPPTTDLRLESYELPGVLASSSVPFPSVTGCDRLNFTPGFALSPTTMESSSPAGASADLRLPQEDRSRSDQLAQPDLKKAIIDLPEGLDLNPSAAAGLASCTEAQMGYVGPGTIPNPIRFNEAPVTCPDASKLGTVQIKTPLLEEELEGTIYLATQEENPFDTLLAIYLVVESGRFGITLKLPGEVVPDPRTGRLTATFDDNPQLPFEDLRLSFRGGGPRSTFATPEICGHYETTGSLEPWSAPESGPPAQISEGGFDVSGGCASSAGARPFGPSLAAGTTSTLAGAYSPLVIRVDRKDGEQELKSLDFSLPKGLLGRIAGVSYCPEAAIKSAESKSGKAEKASPSCPGASRIGSVDTAAGVGTDPLHVSGNVYLAGPYKGAPLSAAVVTPALAGPFDLGVVVIRTRLDIDPETAEITAKSDPIPTILRGIPLKLRSVAISLDRPGFTLNPTSCEPMLVSSSIVGSGGQVAKPQNRFQVGGCDKLAFRPKLKIGLKGSTTRSGHPGLKAVLTYPDEGSYANIRRAQVNLPRSMLLDQGNLDKTCTRPVLLEGKCPRNTIYGRAKAWTPLLANPLEGPVYLVGGYGYKLPALVADLNGQIRVVLKGKVDTGPNKGIRNTFEAVPDAPVSRFLLTLKGGRKYGLLQNSENLCAKKQRAIVRFTGQNGNVKLARPVISDRCGRGRRQHR